MIAGWGTAFVTHYPPSKSIKVQYEKVLGPVRLIHINGVIPEELYMELKQKYFNNIAITEFGSFNIDNTTPQIEEKKKPKGKEITAEIFDENGKRIK